MRERCLRVAYHRKMDRKPVLLIFLVSLLLLAVSPSASAADMESDGVLIKFKPGADRAKVWSQLGLDSAERLKGDPSIIKAEVAGDDEIVADRAEDLPGVADAIPNYKVKVAASAPNDPLFTSQWYLKNTGLGQFPGPGVNKTGEDVKALEAWDEATGEGAVVAVIDTGADIDHEDLKDQLWVNPLPNGDPNYPDSLHGWNYVGNNPDVVPNSSHGTEMSGIIAANYNNGIGVSGVAPESELMILKVGDFDSVELAAAVEAIHFAGTHGAHVVNMSFESGATPAEWFDDAMSDYPDMLFVSSAGNSGVDRTGHSSYYPCFSQMLNSICVAATTSDEKLAAFSNYGGLVEIGAPGSHMYTTRPSDGYNWGSGTSQAAALTSGVAALIQSNSPRASGSFMREKLIEGGTTKAFLSGKTTTGKRLNANGSVLLTDNDPPNTTLDEVTSPVSANPSIAYWTNKDSVAERYECSLNSAPWERCDGGSTVLNLNSTGPHTFRVRALDDAGNYDPIPASVTFTADVTPPETQIVSKPARYTTSQTATFAFNSEPGARFMCELDGNLASCTSPKTYAGPLTGGTHTFEVFAVDTAGNPDPTPATFTWDILLTPPDTTGSGPCFKNGTCISSSGTGEEVKFGMYSQQVQDTEGHYECRLTPPGTWHDCARPEVTYLNMEPGNYKFEVRGVNGAGVPDPTPWTKEFTVLKTVGPDPDPDPDLPGKATVNQTNITREAAIFRFTVTGSADEVRCALLKDGSIFDQRTCVEQAKYENLTPGIYRFIVTPVLSGLNGTSDSIEFLIEDKKPDPDPDPDPDPKPNPDPVAPKITLKAKNLPLKRGTSLPVKVKNENKFKVKHKVCVQTLNNRVWTGSCVTYQLSSKTQRTFNVKVKGLKKGSYKLKVNVFYDGKQFSRQVNVKVR